MIEIKHLTKEFNDKSGKVVALRDVTATIQDGDIFGIIGMSGAGKSTLVRCINLLERPTEGEIIVDGQRLDTMTPAQLRAARRNITMIFQHFNLLMQRTCLRNVCFPMELAGVKKADAEKRARELLELVSQSFPERSGAMPVLLAFVLCLLSAMNDTTAPSVSLEGKQLWLAQSLPVSPWQVLRAKLRLQLLITIPPMLLCLVCLLAVYPGSPLELLFIAVTALSYALLMALLGLFLGLKMPNLSWTNEVVPIKQSACVALSLFSGWAVAMIPGALYLLTGIGSLDPLLYLSVVTALVLILSAVLSLWVKKTGSRIFAAL